nr:PQQ-dependent sugar dehydrogenase [Wenzhouxiangella limi]
MQEQGLIRDWINQGAHREPFVPAVPADVALREVFPADSFANALGLVNAGDGSERLFVVRQNGVIETFARDGSVSDFMTVPSPVSSGGERGLLGLAFHPDFGSNGRFFLNYTAGTEHPSGAATGDTVIAEFQVDPDTGEADPASEQVLMTISQDFSNHNGGQIKFGPDGYLYIGMGDGGSGGDPCDRAQTLDPGQISTEGDCKNDSSVALLGKMLRIDIDNTTPAGSNSLCAAAPDGSAPYAVPDDNPFLGQPACAEVWALGLRNPWRWSFDRQTGDLWIGDVGQNRWEEVSYQPATEPAGANFGWRRCEGPYVYPAQTPPERCAFDHRFPVLSYTTSNNPECSVTGGYRYRGPIHSLQGAYVYGDYCSGRIWLAWQTGPDQFETLEFSVEGVDLRSFGEDENGNLYVVRDGGIWRFIGDEIFGDRFEEGEE